MSEKVAIAGVVDGTDEIYEFEPLYGIAELLDNDDQPVREVGRRGRIVSTGLLNWGMPLIRYDTEDEAQLVREAQEDNCWRLQVTGLRSRWLQEFVVGINGERISIAAINIHSVAYGAIREFQLFQEKPGVVEVRVVPMDEASVEALQVFLEEIQQKVGRSTTFNLRVVERISRNSRGKWKFVEQRVTAATGGG